MSDEPGRDRSPDPQKDRWQDRRNLGERLFPGPSNPMSRQAAEHVARLLRSRGDADPESGAPAPLPGTKRRAAPAAPQPDAHLQETLDAQTELLRAILSSSVDAQADARSTAQNSRTFAWAGTAIALLTLIATVVLIVNGG